MNSPIVRTRFAPSPTGMLHIGGLRTTLFSWLWARKNNGQFIIRLEDTDRTRLVEGAAEQILQSIRALGMDWDYGPDKPGPFGSCIQSERLSTYQDQISILLQNGKAYRDYRSPEELEELRKIAMAEKKPFIYRKSMAQLSGDAGQKHVIRIEIPEQDFIWEDAIKGRQAWSSKDVDDFVAIKSDGFPTYHFANVCDDHAMGITHVLRADEWLASTPKHLLLWQLFGWEAPVYAHVPPILGPDGKRKLSKRDGAKDVGDYMAEGYMPEALMNYLALLGWNDGTEKEYYSQTELIEAFDIGRIQKSGARFDAVKLEWLNGLHIRSTGLDELYARVDDSWHPAATNFSDEYKKEVLALNQDRLKKFSELSALTWYFFKDPSASDELIHLITNETKLHKQKLHKFIERVLDVCTALPSWNTDKLHDALYGLCEELDTKPGVLFKAVRITLVGGKNAPGLFETMNTIGSEVTLRRLKALLTTLDQDSESFAN